MSIVDHFGDTQFPMGKEKVFEALVKAVPTIKGMKVVDADKLTNRVMVKAGISLFSWGEEIPIQLYEENGVTTMKITSTPKTGVMGGGMFDMGKNRKNIELIISATSKMLQS